MPNKSPKYYDVSSTGDVGEIYSTSTGTELACVYDDPVAWVQIAPSTRRKVVRKRISHTAYSYFWDIV